MFAPANLTVPAVFTKLKEIATMTGNSVSNAKFPKVYFQYSLPLMKKWKKMELHNWVNRLLKVMFRGYFSVF